jgi:hypothetical protein
MPGRFHRLQLAALLLLVLLAGYCHAEAAEVECTAEGDCANTDADVHDNAPVENVPEPDVSEETAAEENAAEAVAEETPDEPAETSREDSTIAPPEDPNCPSREYVIRCAGEYLDTNKNGKLDRNELQTVIDNLPWYARGKWPKVSTQSLSVRILKLVPSPHSFQT